MSVLVELYISAKSKNIGHFLTEEEFMRDMMEKEYLDPETGFGIRTVRFDYRIGSGKGRQMIREEHSFEDLRDIYKRFNSRQK